MDTIIPTGGTASYPMKAGDTMSIVNQKPSAMAIRITTACGSKIEAELHPGASLKMTVGSAAPRVELLPPTEDFDGLKAVS